MQKAKKYDWKDTNLALFGSDTEKNVKKEAAETENAWKFAGQKVGLQIWRIVDFEVTDWPKEDYGKFYNGDSYIILYTYKEDDSEELEYDLHFWIGKHSTQDEYGTAAYKTVELDTCLDDKPIQHREVQNHESEMFKEYFCDGIVIMKGGAKSGFRHVENKEIKPCFLFIPEIGNIREANIKTTKKFDQCYVFCGKKQLIDFRGAKATLKQKWRANEYCRKLEIKNKYDCKAEIIDATEDPAEFDNKTEEVKKILAEDETDSHGDDDDDDDTDDEDEDEETLEDELYCVSGDRADPSYTSVKLSKRSIKNEDVDILIRHRKKECVVLIGDKAEAWEKRNGLSYAHNIGVVNKKCSKYHCSVVDKARHRVRYDRITNDLPR